MAGAAAGTGDCAAGRRRARRTPRRRRRRRSTTTFCASCWRSSTASSSRACRETQSSSTLSSTARRSLPHCRWVRIYSMLPINLILSCVDKAYCWPSSSKPSWQKPANVCDRMLMLKRSPVLDCNMKVAARAQSAKSASAKRVNYGACSRTLSWGSCWRTWAWCSPSSMSVLTVPGQLKALSGASPTCSTLSRVRPMLPDAKRTSDFCHAYLSGCIFVHLQPFGT